MELPINVAGMNPVRSMEDAAVPDLRLLRGWHRYQACAHQYLLDLSSADLRALRFCLLSLTALRCLGAGVKLVINYDAANTPEDCFCNSQYERPSSTQRWQSSKETIQYASQHLISGAPQDYVHRIGRTGRAGEKGISCARSQQHYVIEVLMRVKP